jgi:enoyl-CoA hydratase
VIETASSIARYTGFGLRNTKEVMWLNLDVDSMPAAIALENRNQDLAARNEEVRAYMASYAERHRTRSREGD